MKRSILMIACPAVLALAVVLVSPAASAEASAKKQAEALLDEGNKLFDQKDYPGALARFQKAYKLHTDPSILVNLGLTLVKLKRLPEAATRYEQFLKQADVGSHARLIKGIRPQLSPAHRLQACRGAAGQGCQGRAQAKAQSQAEEIARPCGTAPCAPTATRPRARTLRVPGGPTPPAGSLTRHRGPTNTRYLHLLSGSPTPPKVDHA